MDEVDPKDVGGDADAFERFYRAHYERVTRFIARRVDDPYTAATSRRRCFSPSSTPRTPTGPRRGR